MRWIPHWTTHRRKKGCNARQGELGDIGQCVAGDVVACELADGSAIYLQIAWQWPDGKAAMVRLYSHELREISLLTKDMATMRAEQRVRWLGVWAL